MAAADKIWYLAVEKGHQQRGDMSTVHISVGHDDDPLIAQPGLVIAAAAAASQSLQQVGDFLVGVHLVAGSVGHIQYFAAQGKDGLGGTVTPLLGGTAGGISLHKKQLGALGLTPCTVGELARKVQLAGGGLA